MHSPDLALLIAFVSSVFSRVAFCYDESPWQPSYDYYHIDLGELGGNNEGNHGEHRGSVGVKIPVPKDVMVDVINDLGIKLLAIHNERNENNIAISPYGALSVLAALSEGLQGDAVHEILHAAHIPKDRHVIRVGLRDIHRHLKSYFIPEEGFLAGLTLNLNNVTLRDEYEDVLRFYGFDYGSFNNALYPEPFTTQKPPEGSTLGVTLGLSEGTTIENAQEIKYTTAIRTDTRLGGPTTYETTTQGTPDTEITISSLLTTKQGKEVTTIGTEDQTTKTETSTATTSLPPITIPSTITSVPTEIATETITTKVPETTNQETTIIELLQTSESSSEKTTEPATTMTQPENTTEILTTTKDKSETTTETPATESVSISSKISKVTAKVSAESSFEYSEMSTYILETSTAMSSTEISTPEETTTPKVFSRPPPATTKLLQTTIESQKTTKGTITAVPTIKVSETTLPTTTTTVSSETKMTEKISDAQRSTRQISASLMPGDQVLTTPAMESTVSGGETTMTVEETSMSAVSIQETTVPPEEPALPFKKITLPIGKSTVPIEEATVAIEVTTVPIKETTVPIEETTLPVKEPTVYIEVTTVPIGETTAPIEETTLPVKETTVYIEKTTVHVKETTVPIEETTVSVKKTTYSPEMTTLPILLTTFGNEITTMVPDTTPIFQESTVPFMEETDIPFADTLAPIAGTDDSVDSPDRSTLMQFLDQPSENVETTTPFFFETTPDFQDTTTFNQDNFDYNYNYDVNVLFNNTSAVDQVPLLYDDNAANLINNNLMTDRPEGASFNRNLRRRARAVVDYVIARYYDDHHHYPYVAPPPRTLYPDPHELLLPPRYAPQPERPQYLTQPDGRQQYLPQPEPPRRTQYVPQQEPLTFAVYGKYRESGINFMKYDTVLPFFFVPNLKALALSFPLDSTKYYLLLLLPVDDNGVDQLVCDLRLHGNLRYIIDHLKLTHVVATIPSFMLKGYVTLTPLLQRLGIRRIFEPRQADFSPMTNVTDIYVTNIEQAVTVTIRNYLDSSAQHYRNFRQYSPVQFKADHPFLYFVIDSDLHVALMVGKVINPLNSRIR